MWDSISRLADRSPRPVRSPVRLLIQTFRTYDEDQCGTYAAAIAYYALFSLIPLTLVVVSAVGLLVERQRVVDFIFDQIPLQQTASVEHNVQQAVDRTKDISPLGLSLGITALMWSSSGIFGAVRRGLNATSHRRGQSYLHGKLMDFALIPSLGLLIVLSVGLTAAIQVAFERAGDLGLVNIRTNPAVRLTGFALPAVVSFGMFSLLYRFVPSNRPAWTEALAGAGFATALFELAKNLAAYVIGSAAFSTDAALYAGFGTALAFLFWIFITASILLLGAEFARALGTTAHNARGALERADSPEAGGSGVTPAAERPAGR